MSLGLAAPPNSVVASCSRNYYHVALNFSLELYDLVITSFGVGSHD